ncbi:hypothetical protein [Algoriphagus aquaeductus]|uniref:hypothetical protein n=1 Tax=Algoriphagus aquaeductus TaxID=475299 RepID=UPI0011B67735|nr:hypothetical protein [Algoriphagus aquaeductus]
MKKVFFGLAFLGSVLIFNQGAKAQASLPGEGGITCKVEVLICNWFTGTTRQVCHQNDSGVECQCGQSTSC